MKESNYIVYVVNEQNPITFVIYIKTFSKIVLKFLSNIWWI